MPVEITVPPLGESITEAVIGDWKKKVGEPVKSDEPLVELQTDKVTVTVNAPSGGVLAQIAFKPGDSVKVGAVLGTIDATASASASASASAPPSSTSTPSPFAPTPALAPVAAPRPATLLAGSSTAAEAGHDVPMTPVAQRLVEDKGLDPRKIPGSGPGGKIRKDDVLQYTSGNGSSVPSTLQVQTPSITPPQARPASSGPRANAEREERVRMTPLRRRAAERLILAQSTAAILTTFNEVDMGPVMELRKRYQEKFQARHGIKLGFMSVFVRAVIEALKAFPVLNAEIDGDDVIFKRYYDIGVAVAGSRGLVVPVVRDADRLSLAELEKTIGDLGNKARTDKLSLSDLQGGTFTISNGGIFGSMLSTPILNPPQTGILGMHNIQDRAVVRNGQIVVAPVMYVALSYDHRLVDGKEAVQFLVRVKEVIEDPQRILLEV